MGWHWGILASSGGAAGAYDLLETTVLSSDTASVTFSSLGSYSAYKHLQLRMVTRINDPGTYLTTLVRLNNDSGSNYSAHRLQGNGSTVSSGARTTETQIEMGGTSGTTNSNTFGATVIDILDFSNTNKYKTLRGFDGGAIGTGQVRLTSGLWLSTSAVTSIYLRSYSGAKDFIAGSRFSLYGVK